MSAWGAFIGLLVSIFLIIRKVSPVYSLILGALVGGLLSYNSKKTEIVAGNDLFNDQWSK